MTDESTQVEMRVCRRHGGDALPLTTAFPRNKHEKSGYDRMCKQCWHDRPKKSFAGSGQRQPTAKQKPTAQPQVEVPEEIQKVMDRLEKVDLARLSRLPSDRKFFEWSGGPLTEGLQRYKSLYGVHARIVYTYTGNFSRYFLG